MSQILEGESEILFHLKASISLLDTSGVGMRIVNNSDPTPNHWFELMIPSRITFSIFKCFIKLQFPEQSAI